EPVDVALAHPGARVLDEVAPYALGLWAVEVDRAAPRCAVAVGEVGPELAEVVSLGAEMVVDDVEEHRQPVGVAGVDEAPQGVPAGRAATTPSKSPSSWRVIASGRRPSTTTSSVRHRGAHARNTTPSSRTVAPR